MTFHFSFREKLCFLAGILLTFAILFFIPMRFPDAGQLNKKSSLRNSPVVPMVEFPEPAWRTPETLAVTTVASTPFARFEIHKVKTESGAIINDWLWTDERAHVNILVHLKNEDKYLLFYQKKYGLTRPHYAAIGGLFDVGDTPDGCAKRELLEETGLQAEQMIYLGAYRVQVNRGGGILHAFLAKNSVKSPVHKHSDDYEKQEKKLLSRKELIDIALEGKIGEAQWLATIALGLLYEENSDKTS
jgi:8-oxo-dGTP pyrophosphatase MutT (NUDIX family)